jgi:hypothetical protein
MNCVSSVRPKRALALTLCTSLLASASVLIGCRPMEPVPSDAGDTGATDAFTTIDASGDAATPLDAPPLRPLERVLFIGNSYTYYYELPGMVRSIGDASGAPLAVEMVAPGGATLNDHATTSGALARIAEGFDVVVMQAQSLEAFSPAFETAARPFADAIDAAGSRGVWYAHWSRGDIEVDRVVGTRLIEAGYARAAALHGDVVARVGEAFLIAGDRLPSIGLMDPDRSHPSAAGSLLAACVIFQAITDRSPVVPASIVPGLSDEDARALCAIADAGVPCDAQESLCGDACVPWSPMACGDCDTVCDEGDPCRSGVCGCGPGTTGCGGTCVDLLSNPNHCGACGQACGAHARCVDSECACPSGGFDTFSFMTDPVSCSDGGMDGGETLECKAAVHDACRAIGGALGCFSSGFGPATGHSGEGGYRIQCVDAVSVMTTYAALDAIVPGCAAAPISAACSTAIHRLCRSHGAASGFGPVSVSGDDVEVSCLPVATVVRAPSAEVGASRCSADPVTCTIAAWSACLRAGHAAGFGPVEVIGDDVEIVCVDE